MNFSTVNLALFKSPLISLVTIFAYLNLIFFPLSSAVAVDLKDIEVETEGWKGRGFLVNLTQEEALDLQRAVASQENDTVSSIIKSTASFCQSVLDQTPTQIKEMACYGVLSDSVCAQFIGTMYLADRAMPILKWGYQFIKEKFQIKSSPLSLDPEIANDLLKVLMKAGIIEKLLTSADALSVTNLNQNREYTTNGPPVFFLPIIISGAENNICFANFQLEDSLASGVLYSNGTSPLTPQFLHGIWSVGGPCEQGVQPLVRWLAYYPKAGFSESSLKIFASVADRRTQDTGYIHIYHTNPTSSPTNAPTEVPTESTSSPTIEPTEAPTMTTLAPTLTPTGTPTVLTQAPTLTPTGTPTLIPTASPTLMPTRTPTTFTLAPTDIPPTVNTMSPSQAPTLPPITPYDPYPAIIGVVVGLVILTCCCIFGWCWYKNKKRKDQSVEVDDPLLQ